MCGIFGYIKGKKTSRSSVEICIQALKRLEYRGYDSAGIAGIAQSQLHIEKTVGKVEVLEKQLSHKLVDYDVAIAHTRWATHGKLSIENAHPHFDSSQNIAIVHNGIIENYSKLKTRLLEHGLAFISETDSEVIAQLLSINIRDDLLQGMIQTIEELEGSFAIVMIHKKHPETMIACARNCPLVVGKSPKSGEIFISSDLYAFNEDGIEITYLEDNEIVLIQKQKVSFFDKTGCEKTKNFQMYNLSHLTTSKNGYKHYMLKEIHEQPIAFQKSIEGRIDHEFGTASFQELTLDKKELLAINHILILGCGSSLHAGYIFASMIEDLARIPAQCEIASEFRYKDPIISENTLVIAISQSGETADTIAAIKEAKTKGAKIIGICNVENSTLSRFADSTLLIKAGPEISVCSTKAYTCQLAVLSLFALHLARLHHMNKAQGKEFIQHLQNIPKAIEEVLLQEVNIKNLAEKYAAYDNFFFIGRRHMYPTSLESALKLKEISYLNACGYPAGEMKHGPIALVSPDFPAIAMCGNLQTLDKMISNIKEIEARSAPILSFAPKEALDVQLASTDMICMPDNLLDELASIPYSVAGQLFAYHIANSRGAEIDKPRNLAKSVTVE